MTYPTSGRNGNCVHFEEWKGLGDKIIQDKNWSDEYKVFALVTHLAEYYAYDEYRADICHNKSRALMANDYADDFNFMFYNDVGTCWDYTNALAIMCRTQGIPCTSVERDTHTWNVVYINGEWIPIDICCFNLYKCRTEDPSKSN